LVWYGKRYTNMKELLTEFFASILGEAEKKYKARSVDSGRIVPFGSEESMQKAIKAGTHEPVDKQTTSPAGTAQAKTAPAKKEPTKSTPTKNASSAKNKTAEPQSTDVLKAPTPSIKDIITSAEDDADADKPALTADSARGMAERDAAGIVKQLGRTNAVLSEQRTLGVPGPGGARASYGEVGLTDFANETSPQNGGVAKFIKKNRRAVEQAEQKYRNPKSKKKVAAVAAQLGLDIPDDEEAVIRYLGTRDVYAQQLMQQLKENKDSLYYKSGAAGFDGPGDKADEAVVAWAYAQFDGALATHESIRASRIDMSKPYTVIQSEARSQGHDEQIVRHLINELEKAKSSGDVESAQHYQTQLDVWKHAGFHDTMAIGQDSAGRLTVFHITNKKGNDLADIWNNTSPAKALRNFVNGFTARQAAAAEEIPKSKRPRFSETVQVIADAFAQGQKDVSDSRDAAGKAFLKFDITDTQFVRAMHLLESGQIPKQPGGYVSGIVTGKAFMKWLSGLPPAEQTKRLTAMGLKLQKDKKGKVIGIVPAAKKVTEAQIKARLASIQAYGQSTGKVTNDMIRLMDKIAELQTAGKLPTIKLSPAMNTCIKNKKSGSDVVAQVHQDIVTAITKADEELGYPTKDGKNGPHTKTYLGTVMSSLHIDMMVLNYDQDVGAVTGIRNSTPSDFRECMAEMSGFTGDISTAEGRRELNNHILSVCRVNPTTRAIEIQVGEERRVIAEDTWRSSGMSKKVEKKLGESLRECVASKADSRRSQNKSRLLDSLS
jgi:hypothetical protein